VDIREQPGGKPRVPGQHVVSAGRRSVERVAGPEHAYGAGTFAALSFNAPAGTRISDYGLAIEH
jgi:hypothetical protein